MVLYLALVVMASDYPEGLKIAVELQETHVVSSTSLGVIQMA